jgi:hypothetical protein
LLYIVSFAKIDSSRLVDSCQQGRRHLKSGTAELLTNTSRPEMSHLYQTADDLGFVAHFLPVRRGTLGVVSRTMVNLNQGLFTALVKAPCVVSLHVDYFLFTNSVPDRIMEPKPAHETHYHRHTTYFPKIIAVSAVDRSQNSTQPSKSMPLSKELKLSLPDPAPDLEHELDAVLPEILPGAPLGYSM